MKALIIFIYSFYIWEMVSAKETSRPETQVVCGNVFISNGPTLYRIDSLTGTKILIRDGVYQTKEPWCLYKVLSGKPIEIDSEQAEEVSR